MTPAKAKRTWGNILKIPGLSKKDRDNSSSQQATVYSPQFSLPQSYGYVNHKYPGQSSQLIASTPYRDPNKHYLPSNKEKYGYYNATCGRASGNAIRSLVNPAQATAKNAVKYTDWFGSVVGRKPPVRPALSVFHSTPSSSGDKGLSPASPWNNYVNPQSTPAAVEVPALVSLQGHNICMCPDQIFSTRSKKKKKCKQCGKKYGTVKNATAIGSVSRIRPAIPPSFYKVPTNGAWAWPQGATVVYAQPMPIPLRSIPSDNYLRETDEDEDSPPPTPETVRTVRSGNSSKSNESNSTITQDLLFTPKTIPPPPSVPLPSIPQSSKVPPPSKALVKPSMKKADKGISIIGSVKTAYELIECDRGLSSGSDTDELSDNAVHNSWGEQNLKVNMMNKKDSQTPFEINSRVSVITVNGNSSNNRTQTMPNGEVNIIRPTEGDSHKVRIFNSSPSKVVIENKFDKNPKLKLHSNKICERVSSNYNLPQPHINGFQSENFNPYFIQESISPPHPRKRSSHVTKKKKVGLNNYYAPSDEGETAENFSNIVTIAGRRIILNQKQNNKPFKVCQEATMEKIINGNASLPDISDWDSLQEFVNKNTADNFKSETTNLDVSANENLEMEQEVPSVTMKNNSIKNNEFKRNIISPEVIHEEEEDKEEENKIKNIETQNEMDKYKVETALKFLKNEKDDDDDSEILAINGYIKDDEITRAPSPSSSIDPSFRANGFQPSLSELLQVKSILKRPNSLDTSSETDSDFYLPALSSDSKQQNVRKKKSVQFRQSDEVNLVEGTGESKGRKVSSLKAARKERNKRKEAKVHELAEGRRGDYERTILTSENKQSSFNNDFNDKYISNWDMLGENEISRTEENDLEDNLTSSFDNKESLTEGSGTEESQQLNNSTSISGRIIIIIIFRIDPFFLINK